MLKISPQKNDQFYMYVQRMYEYIVKSISSGSVLCMNTILTCKIVCSGMSLCMLAIN